MYSKINNQAPLYWYWHSLMSPVYCIDSCCVCDSNCDGWVDAWTMTLIVFINNKGWGTEAWSTKGLVEHVFSSFHLHFTFMIDAPFISCLESMCTCHVTIFQLKNSQQQTSCDTKNDWFVITGCMMLYIYGQVMNGYYFIITWLVVGNKYDP